MPIEIKMLEREIKETRERLRNCDKSHRASYLKRLEILYKDLERENFKYGGFTE